MLAVRVKNNEYPSPPCSSSKMRVELNKWRDQVSQMFPTGWALKVCIESFTIPRTEPMEASMNLLVKGRIGKLWSGVLSVALLELLLHHL